MLRLADDWVWDFWHVAHNGAHHLFYLHAPRALGDPERRHWHATIGHAVSTDLVTWTVLADALGPAPSPAWDDHTTWTGNVVRDGDAWHLFYTGTSRAEDGLVQRVGHAISTDLESWQRVGNGLAFELDERWYERLDPALWHDQAWRDPVVVRYAGTWVALVTARLRSGPAHRRGTIGAATSGDLTTWAVRPPLTGPTPFGQLEIPDVRRLGGRWYLLFASALGLGDPDDPPQPATTGTWAVPSTDGPLGPWEWRDAHVVVADGWYGSKLIAADTSSLEDPSPEDASLVLLAWRERDADGSFGGWIGDPMPVALVDGRLVVTSP